jgi:hypothetical protein
VWGTTVAELGCAVERWADEAAIVLRAEGRSAGTVLVRCGVRRRLLLDLGTGGEPAAGGSRGSHIHPGHGDDAPSLRITAAPGDDGAFISLPVLPDAATWALPDLELIRAGALDAERLHPLVASALVPDHARSGPHETLDRAGRPRLVECRGERHRIGLVDGTLTALDHDPAELRREELLVRLTGTPLPCLRAIDAAHRRPDCLSGVRERLDHGDIAGALAVVEAPRRCCARALCGTNWSRPRAAGSSTACTAPVSPNRFPDGSGRNPAAALPATAAHATRPSTDPTGPTPLRTLAADSRLSAPGSAYTLTHPRSSTHFNQR